MARSAEFAGQWLAEKQCPPADIAAVQRKIRCTGVNVNLAAIPFSSLVERVGGFAVGTSDLLGQMAAPDYVDKLPVLYSEFEESGRYNGGSQSGVGVFASAEDLMRQTPRFWENYVRPKLERDFAGIYQFLNQPYPDGANYYLDRIGANIARLQRQMAAVAP